MEHPTPEEWMDYLYSGLDRGTRRRLAAHLRECDECREAVAGWRGTMAKLDAWHVAGKRPLVTLLRQAVRLAAAVLLVLAVGYGIGRLSASGTDVEALRAEIESGIRHELLQEVNAEWRAALATMRSQLRQDLYQQLGADLDELAVEAFAASSAVTTRMLGDFYQSLEATRIEERQAILAALRVLEQRRAAQDARQIGDLATLAELTENELLRTRQDVATVLAWRRPATVIEREFGPTDTRDERSPQ